jgi:hypothetical protein
MRSDEGDVLPAARIAGAQAESRGHPVQVEVIYLRLQGALPGGDSGGPGDGSSTRDEAAEGRGPAQLAYRTRAASLPRGLTPDELARRLSRGEGVDDPRATGVGEVIHSTSWRFDPVAGVVLTYVVLPDPGPAAPARILHEPAVVCSGDPRRPAPPVLHDHHIVAHAVRHLADLAGRDPAIITAAREPASADLWTAIIDVAQRIPTGTHVAAHQQAHADGRRQT